MITTQNDTLGRGCRMLLAVFIIGLGLAGCATEETQDVATDMPADTAETMAMTDAEDDPIARGRATYEAYCASCHGPDGSGNGPVAADLAVPPADLTQLAALHDGTFPVDSVYQTIDGRKDVEAHGTRDMPVWGNIWSEEDGEPVRPEVVEQRINELVEYLRTLQAEPQM